MGQPAILGDGSTTSLGDSFGGSSTLLSDLLVLIDDILTSGNAAALPLAVALLGLLDAILATAHAARSSYLASVPALTLLARCALHPSADIRRGTRDVLVDLLFDAAAASVAAAAPNAFDLMPHETSRATDALLAPWAVLSLPLVVLSSFGLTTSMLGRAEEGSVARGATGGVELAGFLSEERVSRALVSRRAFRAVSKASTGPSSPGMASSFSSSMSTADGDGDILSLPAREVQAAEDATREAQRLAPATAAAAALATLDDCASHSGCLEAVQTLHAVCASVELLTELRHSSLLLSAKSRAQIDAELDSVTGSAPPTVGSETHPLLSALAAKPPTGTLYRLLTLEPSTDDDDAVLSALLALFTRALDVQPASTNSFHAPAVLVDQLAIVGARVLDRSADQTSKPFPRMQLRSALLRFGAALLQAYPALGSQLIDSGTLIATLAEQYAAGSATGRGEGSVLSPPPPVRLLALELLHRALNPAGNSAGGATKRASAHLSARVSALLPSLVNAAAGEREARSMRNTAATRLAAGCIASALTRILSRGEKGLHWLWSHGFRWLHRLMTADDFQTRAAAFRVAAALAVAPPSRACLCEQLPETLTFASKAAVDAACPPRTRAAALRFLITLCATAAADDPASDGAGGTLSKPELWLQLSRLRLPARLLEVFDEEHAAPQCVGLASDLLLVLLLHVNPNEMKPIVFAKPQWHGTLRWLQVEHHWAAYVNAQGLSESVEGDSGFGKGRPGYGVHISRASHWVYAVLPRVHRARASLLRLFRGLLTGLDTDLSTVNSATSATSALATLAHSPFLHAAAPALLPTLTTPAVRFTPPSAVASRHIVRSSDPELVAALFGMVLEDDIDYLGPTRGGTGVQRPIGLTEEHEIDDGEETADVAGGGASAAHGDADHRHVHAHKATQASLAAVTLPPAPFPADSLQGLYALMTHAETSARQPTPTAASASAVYEAQHEGIRLWTLLLSSVPAAHHTLLSCTLGEGQAPWAATIAFCLAPTMPMSLRVAACGMICALLDGAPSGVAPQQLDEIVDFGFASKTSVGTRLAELLLMFYNQVGPSAPSELPRVSAALRSLVGMSASAKLTLLRNGFLPSLLGRIDDLRTLALTPLPGGGDEGAQGGQRHRDAPSLATRSTTRSRVHHQHEQPIAAAVAKGVSRVESMAPLMGALKLLSNLVAGCNESKLCCVSLQLPLLMLRLWPMSSSSAALRSQLLTLLCTYVAHCPAAKASLSAYSDSRGHCLATLLVRMITRPARASQPPISDTHWRLGWGALRSLATSTESRTALVRSHLIPKAVPLLLRNLGAADESRAAPVLDFFANLAFEHHGQAGMEGRDHPSRHTCALTLAGPHTPFAPPHSRSDTQGARGLRRHPRGPGVEATRCTQRCRSWRAQPRLRRRGPRGSACQVPGDPRSPQSAASVRPRPRGSRCCRRVPRSNQKSHRQLFRPLTIVWLDSRCHPALWALVGRCERAKAMLRGATLQAQLRAAERALTSQAMVMPPSAAAERKLLGESLHCMGAVMSALQL